LITSVRGGYCDLLATDAKNLANGHCPDVSLEEMSFQYGHSQGQIQVLLGLKLIQFWGLSLRKKNAKLGMKVDIYL